MAKKLLSIGLLVFFSFNFSIAQKHDTQWKLIDENGKELFSVDAKYVNDFNNGLAGIYQQVWDGKEWIQGYGFIDKFGKIVIPCIYKKVQDFDDSLVTWVQTNEKKWILIDRKGNKIATKDYTNVGTFFKGNHGLSAVYEGEKMGFINREGKEVIPCKFAGSQGFKENRACVRMAEGNSEVYGFINRSGKIVIPMQYSQAGISEFYKGTCRVQKKGTKTFLIDSMGNTVFKTKYGSLQNMNFGLAPVSLGNAFDKWSFVNMKDEIAIKGPFDFTHTFNDAGLTDFEVKEKIGLMDTTGKEILPAKYDVLYYDMEEDGYICGVYGDRANPKSLFDSEKDYFLEGMKKFDDKDVIWIGSANYGNRMAYANKDKKYGFMDRTGKIIIEAQYVRAYPFKEGAAWVK